MLDFHKTIYLNYSFHKTLVITDLYILFLTWILVLTTVVALQFLPEIFVKKELAASYARLFCLWQKGKRCYLSTAVWQGRAYSGNVREGNVSVTPLPTPLHSNNDSLLTVRVKCHPVFLWLSLICIVYSSTVFPTYFM